MTIRLKILSLAFLILIIFGVVLGISTSLQHDFIIQIDALTRYHVPLRTLIARFDVLTYEYELIMMRLLRRSDITQRDIESARAQARQYADQIVDDLRQINALLDQAVADRGAGEQSVVVFSQLKGSIPFIERQLDPFIKIGEGVLRAIADDRSWSRDFNQTVDDRNSQLHPIRLGQLPWDWGGYFRIYAYCPCLTPSVRRHSSG